MTVADNMGFALKIAGVAKAESATKRVAEAAKILDLERVPRAQAEGALRWPAPARRHGPRDRPSARRCSAWTSRCRTSTPSCACRPAPQIAALQRRLGVTTVYVTHDQVEAMTMGDRVAVLKDGVLQQVDTPREPLRQARPTCSSPASSARPQMNLLEAHGRRRRRPRSATTWCRSTATASSEDAAATSPSACGPRPGASSPTSEGGLPVDGHRRRGARRRRASSTAPAASEGTPDNVIVRVDGRDTAHKGETIYVTTDPQHVHVFDTDTGQRLSK